MVDPSLGIDRTDTVDDNDSVLVRLGHLRHESILEQNPVSMQTRLPPPTYTTMPCTEVIAIAGIVLHSDVPLAIHLFSIDLVDCVINTHPLSAVMKTRAMSLPAAAFAAPVKSVSLRDEVTVVPSCFALVVIASTGYILTISGALDGGKKGDLQQSSMGTLQDHYPSRYPGLHYHHRDL